MQVWTKVHSFHQKMKSLKKTMLTVIAVYIPVKNVRNLA